MIVALILTVVSMFDYIYNARFVFKTKDEDQKNLDIAKEVVSIATKRNIKIGVAESLTGGLVASEIVKVPGASSVFAGCVVSYMYHVKSKLLGVSSSVLKNKGAVNVEVAKQMALGALKALECEVSVSTTGIAGPDKDEFDTSVGTVFIACASKSTSKSFEFKFDGSRDEIRNKAVNEALKILKNFIK